MVQTPALFRIIKIRTPSRYMHMCPFRVTFAVICHLLRTSVLTIFSHRNIYLTTSNYIIRFIYIDALNCRSMFLYFYTLCTPCIRSTTGWRFDFGVKRDFRNQFKFSHLRDHTEIVKDATSFQSSHVQHSHWGKYIPNYCNFSYVSD